MYAWLGEKKRPAVIKRCINKVTVRLGSTAFSVPEHEAKNTCTV